MQTRKQTRQDAYEVRSRKLRILLILQVALPVLIIVGVWLASEHFYGVKFAFEKSFMGADTVLVAVSLLTTLIVEMQSERLEFKARTRMPRLDTLWLVTVVCVTIAAMIFGLIKGRSVQYDFPTAPGVGTDHSIIVCVWCSIICSAMFMVWGLAVAMISQRKFLEAELNG